ncbi:hypothetical protein QYM42_02435 [Lactococcus lactis]|uniref:hypothetical protein n=1 Tax=Lactococcus lactis TaxID=1358 RepID=UPI00265910EB|nr:hypothetical protein [Lactococcus lactis]WKF73643.1 hypothetical protein QYM42_02435 [Lactococcus lactis]
MTETAKELIENEIKSVEKRLHRGRNYGKTYNTGVKEGLMIARAHVIDSSTTDEKTVEKLQEQLNTAKKALTEITKIPESDNYFDEEERLSCIKEAAEKALAAIGNERSGDE